MFSAEQAFTLQFSTGVIAALFAISWFAFREDAKRIGAWLDVALAALIGGTLVGRLVHVLLNWDYFSEFPADSVQIWLGGLSWHGALLGGFIAVVLMCRVRNVPFMPFTDALALALPLPLMSAWWACRDAGCGYGPVVDPNREVPGWLTGYLPDVAGDITLRLELQIFAVIVSTGLLILVTILTVRNWLPGYRLWIMLFLTGLLMAVLGFLRDDPADIVLGRRLDQNLDIVLMIFSVIAGGVVYERRHHLDRG